jgi:hypothetical protein
MPRVKIICPALVDTFTPARLLAFITDRCNPVHPRMPIWFERLEILTRRSSA